MEDNTMYTYDGHTSFPLVFIKCNGAWYRKTSEEESRKGFYKLGYEYMETYYFRHRDNLIQTTPIPEEVLAELVQAKLLGLFN